MNKDIRNLLAEIPFEDLWESELLWPDPMEAPDVPKKEDLVAFLQDPGKINSDLARQIESSVACLRALEELQAEDPAKDKSTAAATAFFQKVGIADDQRIHQSEDDTPNNNPELFPPANHLPTEVRCGQIRSVRTEYQCWDGERISRKFNFKPVDLLITSDRIERFAGDFFRAVPCSPAETWRTEDMLCPEDVVFTTIGGSQWVLHTWLGYPVSVNDLDDCLGKLSQEETARIHNEIEALTHSAPDEITEPEWLSLERERLAERADTLPNTVDAQRWELEFVATTAPDSKTSGDIIDFKHTSTARPTEERQRLALAARDDAAERPLVTRLYRVADNPESTIQVSESIDPTKLAFEVMEDPSNLFAGADIFDASQKPMGKIEDGIAYVDRPKDSRFSLFAADGIPILLEYTSDEHRLKARLSLTDIRRSRSLMFFLRDEALDELSQLRCADPDLRQQLLVESVFRLWLYPKASPERRLKIAELSKSLWDLAAAPEWPSYNILSAWLERSRQKRCFDVPEELGHGPARQVGELLRKRIDTWKNAAGVIPFVGLHDDLAEAVALPFDIRPSDQNGGQVLAGDASAINGLNASLHAANGSPFLKNMRSHDIWIPDVDRSTAELLEGRSAGLPLFIALRGYLQSTSLPPFMIAATGILSDNGLPDPLAQTSETVARKVRMLREIGFDRILVAGPLDGCDSVPDVLACCSEDDLSHQLRSLDSLHSQIRTLILEGPHSIQKRLGEIDREMKAGHMSPAEAKSQLQQLLGKLSDAADIFSSEIREELRLVLATAECHLGNPEVSEALLNQVFQRRSLLGEYSRTRALIRQAVNLNDFGRYRDAAAMVLKQLESIRSSTLSASQRIRLELEALGTAGQALTNLGLIDTQVRDQARECLTAACDLARQLDTPDSSRPELPQDLCYLYQWHAFFDRSGCDRVWKEFETVTPSDHSSWDHMKRLRWLAAYRALMEGEHFAWRHYEDDLPSRKSGNDVIWLYRLARKYRGALRAAEGDLEGSQQDFEESVQLIDDSKNAPILQLLGVTAALEAVRSMAGISPETADRYQTLARETLKTDLANFFHTACPRIANHSGSASMECFVQVLKEFPY